MMRRFTRHAAVGLAAATALLVPAARAMAAAPDTTTTVGWTDQGSYDGAWAAGFGSGQGTRTFGTNTVTVSAPVFTGIDFSVYDHLKYIRTSAQSFDVPTSGSLTFAVDITASTPGTEKNGRTIKGCYMDGPNYVAPVSPPPPPAPPIGSCTAFDWSQKVLEGQQAGVVLNMINFQTGQLFDWFVSENYAFALIERLPSSVTGGTGVGLDKAYTQIIKQYPIKSGVKHNVAITFSREHGEGKVEYVLDGKTVAEIGNVGVPLNRQKEKYTGSWASFGPGEQLGSQLDSFVIGHGLFSLLDPFPFQHPDCAITPGCRAVSIPAANRAFGQGATGTFSNFTVRTRADD